MLFVISFVNLVYPIIVSSPGMVFQVEWIVQELPLMDNTPLTSSLIFDAEVD